MRLKKKQAGSKWDPYVFDSFTPNSARCEGRAGGGEQNTLHLIREHPIQTRGDRDRVPIRSQKTRILVPSLLSAFSVPGPVLGTRDTKMSRTGSCPQRTQRAMSEINI